VVIGILVAVAVVAAAIVAVTILGSDDGDSTSDPTDVPTTDGSTTVPTTSTAMDLPTAAAAARIDEVVDESGVGDDGRYSIEDQECPLADVTVRGLVDASPNRRSSNVWQRSIAGAVGLPRWRAPRSRLHTPPRVVDRRPGTSTGLRASGPSGSAARRR